MRGCHPRIFRSAPVQEQLGAILSAIPDPWHDAESWRKVVLQLDEMPKSALQDPRIAAVSTLTPVVALLDVAAHQPANAEDAIGKLIQDYGRAGPEVRELLDLQLPPLLLWHPKLALFLPPATGRCATISPITHLACCTPSHTMRGRRQRLYLAVRVLGQAKLGEYANVLEKNVLAEALTKWNRDELDEVTAQIEGDQPEGSRNLQAVEIQTSGAPRQARPLVGEANGNSHRHHRSPRHPDGDHSDRCRYHHRLHRPPACHLRGGNVAHGVGPPRARGAE